MVDSAPPPGASPLRGKCWRGAGGCRLCVSVDGAAGLTARWWRAPSAAVRFALSPPGARGCAPLPPDPYPRQAELAGFCALRARAALRAGCFCAGARSDPPCARWWRAPSAPLALLAAPEGRGCAPLPPDPRPRQAELAGFCALPRACCASRRCCCAGARSYPPCCAGACCDPPVCAGACHHPPVCAQSQLRQSLPPTLSHCSKASLSCSE